MTEKNNTKLLFAVASNDGRVINQHFGHAERFLIYRWENQKVSFVGKRQVERYCLPENADDHEFMEKRFESIVNTIKDCRYLLISRIGVIPEEKLREMGIVPVMAYELIEKGIEQVIDQLKLTFNGFDFERGA